MTSAEDKAAPILNAPVAPIRWKTTIELGYSLQSGAAAAAAASLQQPAPVCFGCGQSAVEGEGVAAPPPLSTCARCKVAGYCQRECQVSDWKSSHKLACASYARVAQLRLEQNRPRDNETDETLTAESSSRADPVCAEARNEIFARIRFYACPYAVTKQSSLGRGFLFVQSDQTLAVQSLGMPKNVDGRSTGMRSVMVHYLTLGEYDQEVCRDDFEMTAVRSALQEAVAAYNEQSDVVVLMRFRCGHVALGTADLVPEYNVCKALGKEYFASDTAGALQLNLDDL